jgi:O-antigen/teichoic acid export membrane protein
VAAVGIFTVAARVTTLGKMFHRSIVTSAMPIISEMYNKGELEQLGRFYRTATRWTFSFNLPFFLIVLLFSEPILSIFGESFVAGSTALVILSFGNVIDAGTGICGAVITMTGRPLLNTLNSFLVLALTLVLNILLIPRLGVIGAAIPAAAATSLINLLRLSQVFMIFRLLPYDKTFFKPIVGGIAATAVAYLMARRILVGGDLVSTALNIILFLAVYITVTLLLGLSEEDRLVLAGLRRRLKPLLPG